MGVRAALLAMVIPGATLNAANKAGTDIAGEIETMELACLEMIAKCNDLNNRILTPVGDSTNAAILSSQITALS